MNKYSLILAVLIGLIGLGACTHQPTVKGCISEVLIEYGDSTRHGFFGIVLQVENAADQPLIFNWPIKQEASDNSGLFFINDEGEKVYALPSSGRIHEPGSSKIQSFTLDFRLIPRFLGEEEVPRKEFIFQQLKGEFQHYLDVAFLPEPIPVDLCPDAYSMGIIKGGESYDFSKSEITKE